MMDAHPDATTWVSVSAGALANNFQAVSAHAGVPVCAVVKANAYGHGLTQAAAVFEQAGARWLAVTRVEEAVSLRRAGIAVNLLVLTPPPSAALTTAAIASDCAIALSDVTDVARFAEAARIAGRPARVHMKVDTGMGRLGVSPADAPSVAETIAGTPDTSLDGVFTHFADAAGASGAKQLALFQAVRTALGKRAARAIVHASNSAALLSQPDARFDLVRIGTLLYGQNPAGATAPFPLEETFVWRARVIAVRSVAAGDSVGYGSEWTAKRPSRIATLAIGWGDGFTAQPHARPTTLANAASGAARSLAAAAGVKTSPRVVYFGSRKAPVVGRAGMQAVSVLVDDGVAVGDVARIPARRLLVGSHIERVYHS